MATRRRSTRRIATTIPGGPFSYEPTEPEAYESVPQTIVRGYYTDRSPRRSYSKTEIAPRGRMGTGEMVAAGVGAAVVVFVLAKVFGG